MATATDDAGTTISSNTNMSQCTQKCKWCSRGTCPVDITKYHACHVKLRWMSPSASLPRQQPRRPRVPRRPKRATGASVIFRKHRYMSTVSCNSTSKDDDIAACWTCQAPAASVVAPTESRQHKNSGNRLHRKCFDLSWTWSFFLSITWPRQALDLRGGRGVIAVWLHAVKCLQMTQVPLTHPNPNMSLRVQKCNRYHWDPFRYHLRKTKANRHQLQWNWWETFR